ncbi:hypothetical protein D3250_05465 [Nesterenkonia natronophila]|uniref:O-antigen ligase-related domain-containing protein n=1 Tax=Nesterenkonia natronophila TaxID=2174932 RepID=A0A3A4F560_9MICC|nr:hypothetical protein D3250_05465 [Nesterenkonia natronophila]
MLFGVALNHTSLLYGFNLSVADAVAAIILAIALMTGRFFFPLSATYVFLMLSVLVLIVGGFITPVLFPIDLSASQMLSDYLKLATSFCYFLLGINIARTGYAPILLRVFALTAAGIGAAGIVLSSLPQAFQPELLFYGEFRFRGFINDPNYFAVLQIAAMALLWDDEKVRASVRVPALVILSISVLLSASKTGAIVLMIYLIWRLVRTMVSGATAPSSYVRFLWILLMLMAAGVLAVMASDPERRLELATTFEATPALNRLAPLLIDFESGIEGGGSTRDVAWGSAVTIIEAAPLIGVGVGTYLDVSQALTGHEELAHNTFLQIAAEWGLLVAGVFVATVILLMVRRPSGVDTMHLWLKNRDAVLVMLMGSMGVSLNNARQFWLILGILVATHLFASLNYGAKPKTRSLQDEPTHNVT